MNMVCSLVSQDWLSNGMEKTGKGIFVIHKNQFD